MKKPDLRQAMLCISFYCFILPYSINIGGEGIGANYSFILLPLYLIIKDHKICRPLDVFLYAILIYTCIFIVASLYQTEFIDQSARRACSFILFLSIFSFIFIRIDSRMLNAFKFALIAMTVYFSAHAVIVFMISGGASLGYEAKDLVGTQRIGFMYLLAFWLLVCDFRRIPVYFFIKYLMIAVTICGIFLTYSRASIVSLLGSSLLYTGYHVYSWVKNPAIRPVLKGIYYIIGAMVAVTVIFLYLPNTVHFFDDRLFTMAVDSQRLDEALDDQDSSEGTRFLILKMIINFVSLNPLTGTGYLGSWAISDGLLGSAHSQYTDVLLRTGVFGLLIYLWLLLLTLKYLYVKERALFWGVLAVLIYGFFHETFKETQGTVVLAFLFGLMQQHEVILIRRPQSIGLSYSK